MPTPQQHTIVASIGNDGMGLGGAQSIRPTQTVACSRQPAVVPFGLPIELAGEALSLRPVAIDGIGVPAKQA